MDSEIGVLHVDDDRSFADLTRTFLERIDEQFTVRTATSADDGLATLDSNPPDCIVSDYDMPGTDGLEFLEAVRLESPDLPFILFTGKGSEEVASDAIAVGVTDYLQKGSGTEQYELLANRIRNAVRARREARRADQQERITTQVLDALEDLFYVFDTDGSLRRWNSRVPELTGYTDRELTDMQAVEFFPEDERETIADAFGTTLADGTATAEADLLTADGERLPCEFTGARLTDEDGTATGLVGVGRDLTERRRQQRRFQALVEESRDIISVIDAAGVFRYQSPAVERVLEYDAAETIGDTVWEYIHPDDRERLKNTLEAWVATPGATGPVQYRARHADGSWRWMEANGNNQLENPAVGGYVVTSRDVTERTEYEQGLEAQNERLEEFASIVSHDLRNPLGVVEGRLELAQEACESDHLHEARGALERSQALIDDLLTIAREGDRAAEFDPVDLADVARCCWETVETDRATLEVARTPVVRADRSRLKQLFENLHRNAVEHGGADVTVHVGGMEGGFYVADTGPGIPDSEREAVFEAGYSTSDGGTGFGLRIAEEVADAHGWEIAVTESERGGARFEITGVEHAER
jgi:PAS domain S-box-containing protein